MSIPVVFAGGTSPQTMADGKKQDSQVQTRERRAAAARLAATLPQRKSSGKGQEDAAPQLKKTNAAFNRKLQFEVNHESQEVTVKVIDANTDKIIKVLPPKELQRLRHGAGVGAILNEQV